MKRRTRNEMRQRRYKLFYWLSILVWALFIIWVTTTTAKSEDAPEPQKTVLKPVIEEQEDVGALPGDDRPASGYATLDVLDSIGIYKVTAYCSCPVCCGIWSQDHPSRQGTDYVQMTRSGTIPQEGRTIAADWSVLPEGTEIVLEGHTYTVEDTGSAVDGKHIDLYIADHQTAAEWGVRYIELYKEAK